MDMRNKTSVQVLCTQDCARNGSRYIATRRRGPAGKVAVNQKHTQPVAFYTNQYDDGWKCCRYRHRSFGDASWRYWFKVDAKSYRYVVV
jgi:hypothetical protein